MECWREYNTGMRRTGRECLYLQIVYVQNIHSTCTSLKENKKQDKTNIHVHGYIASFPGSPSIATFELTR